MPAGHSESIRCSEVKTTETTMTDERHLAVVDVDSAEDADVTLRGDESAMAELVEATDVWTNLQQSLDWELADDLDVDVIPRRGLAGAAATAADEQDGDE